MRWSVPTPNEGDKRIRRRFAWEPIKVTDKDGAVVRVWLEFYMVTEEFVKYQKEIIEEWKILDRKVIVKKS